jgi:preprotein translocase subunit SecG
MVSYLMVFHMFISVLLIVFVLLQFGKGAEAGLMSGGGGEVFTGSQQGNILRKITIVLSVIFMGNSIFLAKIQSSSSSKSILDDEAPVSRPLNTDALNQKAEPKAAAPKAEAPPATDKK